MIKTRIALIFIIICICIALVFLLLIPYYKDVTFKANIGQLKSNAHYIQIAVERYTTDNCTYPIYPQQLEDDGYLDNSKLINPFTKKRMELIEYEPDKTFSAIAYIPLINNGYAYTYYVVALGPEGFEGHDIDDDGLGDNIVIACQCSCDRAYDPDCEEFYGKIRFPDQVPTLKEALKEVKWVWQ